MSVEPASAMVYLRPVVTMCAGRKIVRVVLRAERRSGCVAAGQNSGKGSEAFHVALAVGLAWNHS